VRGTLRIFRRLKKTRRFIPARAGNTADLNESPPFRSVHPRACGEHNAPVSVCIRRAGSSPRVRGTLQGRLSQPQKKRFIPARAGNTRSATYCLRFWTVHPRACGEHPVGYTGFGNNSGSSPRVRGTRRHWRRKQRRKRFIPARAGNTRSRGAARVNLAVHPRACGEHHDDSILYTSANGSSPRVRGTPIRTGSVFVRSRFIPARAGNTLPGFAVVDFCRFIPARAGNTQAAFFLCAFFPVHPRACGEHPA